VLPGSFTLFLLSILVFGSGVGAGYQLRVAAADMYPPNQRARALGLVLTGSLVGALGGPLLITTAQNLSGSLGLDPLALTWILVPAVILPGSDSCSQFIPTRGKSLRNSVDIIRATSLKAA
jgi:MFS family permease